MPFCPGVKSRDTRWSQKRCGPCGKISISCLSRTRDRSLVTVLSPDRSQDRVPWQCCRIILTEFVNLCLYAIEQGPSGLPQSRGFSFPPSGSLVSPHPTTCFRPIITAILRWNTLLVCGPCPTGRFYRPWECLGS